MINNRREVYAPFEYPEAFEFWKKQQQAHWLASEVSMSTDINDWKTILDDKEKNIISNILKGFVQSEVLIENYWSQYIPTWFPKPEICMASAAMANMESIHTQAYAYLNESLGIIDFDAFLYEPSAKAKMDRIAVKTELSENIEDMALSLAIFSAFTEGVQLFSSFAVLMNYSRFNKMKGVGQIVSFSVRDESLHSEFGCWLFRQLIKEYPEIWNDSFKKKIYEAARETIRLEDDFIDKVFELGDIEGLSKDEMKNFIRMRANAKLNDLGLKNNWKNIDKGLMKQMEWFDVLTTGVIHTDFFAQKVAEYSKSQEDFDVMWDD